MNTNDEQIKSFHLQKETATLQKSTKSVVYMRFRMLCTGVVLFMIYSALLITLTLSLTSRSDGDLLGPVSSLRVCQERVHRAVFVLFFLSEEKI